MYPAKKEIIALRALPDAPGLSSLQAEMETISRFAANLKISAASPLSKRKASFRFEKEDGRSGYEVFVIRQKRSGARFV